jgi:hypothetical protein
MRFLKLGKRIFSFQTKEKIMAHNLLIQNGHASMFYINEVPWHGLGTKLDKPATAKEAITTTPNSMVSGQALVAALIARQNLVTLNLIVAANVSSL